MTPLPDENPPDAGPEIAPRLSGPAYPLQPEDAERPVPARLMPDRTEDPDDWDVESTEPSSQRAVDEVVADRRAAEDHARREDDGVRDEALSSGTEDESAYRTELEQGAAQPRPDGA